MGGKVKHAVRAPYLRMKKRKRMKLCEVYPAGRTVSPGPLVLCGLALYFHIDGASLAQQFLRVRVGVSFCRESPWLPVDLISVVTVKFVHHRSSVGVERWWSKANKKDTSSVFALHFRCRWKRVRSEWLKQSQEALDCCGHLG